MFFIMELGYLITQAQKPPLYCFTMCVRLNPCIVFHAVLYFKMEPGRLLLKCYTFMLPLLFCYAYPKAFNKEIAKSEICQKKICEFTLTVREEFSMTSKIEGRIFRQRETLLVEMKNGKLVQRRGLFYQQPIYEDQEGLEVNVTDDVITADGVQRSLVTINGVFPGPTLQVMEGSEVAIHVENQMLHQGLTLHWHGIHQRNTPWMDGVAYITQCPISPMNSFTYRFKASPAGTLWYHAHMGGLRADGAFGLFIIHRKQPTIPFFPFLLNHWIHIPFSEYMTTNIYRNKYWGETAGSGQYTFSYLHVKDRAMKTPDGVRLSSMQYSSALINGRGRFNDSKTPLSWFKVKSNASYGFYIVNPGVEYTFEVSVDQHRIQIIGIDMSDIKPAFVDAIYLNPGERVKIRIETNQPVGNYWMRSRTLDHAAQVTAVLHYEGATSAEPLTSPSACSKSSECIVYNCPMSRFPDGVYKRCIAPYQLKSSGEAVELAKEMKTVDKELFFDFAFPVGSSINGYRFVHPKNHLYSELPEIVECDKDKCKKACFCTQIVDVPFNKTIQMVFTNYGDVNAVKGHHHTIHLHGHDFVVLKTGYPEFNHSSGQMTKRNKDISCPDRLCRQSKWTNYPNVAKEFNLKNPPAQDAVLLPYGGYAVVRIRTDNPGSWLMHCHQMMHAIEGMDVVIRVAPEKIPAPPEGFPKYCGGFKFSHEAFQKYMEPAVSDKKVESNGAFRHDPCFIYSLVFHSLVFVLLYMYI